MSFDQTDRPAFRVVRRGYDRVQVDKYLDSLGVGVGARQRAKTAPEDPASQARYAPVSDHVAQVMRAFDDEVERLRAQASEEVERMLSEARSDADRIQHDAKIRAIRPGTRRTTLCERRVRPPMRSRTTPRNGLKGPSQPPMGS